MQTFSEKRKYYIRLDKNYEGKEKGTFYPKITFKRNEITGKVEPHIELCDSIYRVIKQISLDGNSDNEDAVDWTEISGLELKQMIEKMNQVYGKDFKIDCHIRRFESIFSSDFLKTLPSIHRMLKREDYFFKSGILNVIFAGIAVVLFLIIVSHMEYM